MIVKTLALSAATAALIACGSIGVAHAQSSGYCEGVAEAAADREAPRGGVIGGVVGTLDGVFTGGAGYDSRWRAAYNAAYDACLDTRSADAVDYGADLAIEPPATVIAPEESVTVIEERAPVRTAYVARPEPWSEAWFAYCEARYRSFDPSSGTFLSYSGTREFCR